MAARGLHSAEALAAATPSGGMPAAARAADLVNPLLEKDVLHGWLLDEAGLSKGVAEKAGAILLAQDVETVDDLAWFAALPAFGTCGISALVADKIRAAIAGRTGPIVVAGTDSFTTPTSTRMSGKLCGTRAAHLFRLTEAGSSHYDGGPTAGEPARPRLEAGASLEAAAPAAASEGAMVESAWPESASARSCGGCRPELEAMAAATLQAAARRRQARSEHGAAVAAASGCRHETAARSGGLLLKGLSDSSEPRRERSRCSSARR